MSNAAQFSPLLIEAAKAGFVLLPRDGKPARKWKGTGAKRGQCAVLWTFARVPYPSASGPGACPCRKIEEGTCPVRQALDRGPAQFVRPEGL